MTHYLSVGIKAKDVRHISVPQYEGLALKHISAFLNNGQQHLFQYMPDQQEVRKVSKDWICNVCATVLGGKFSGWVRARIEERNEAVKKARNLDVDVDPEVAAVFHASTKVSRKYCTYYALDSFFNITVTKGVSANLMKVGSKRRRTKAQIEEDKEEEIRKQDQAEADREELEALRSRVGMLEYEAGQGKVASQFLSQMINEGHVQQDTEHSIILHAAAGQHRFGIDAPHQDGDGQ